MGGLELGLLLAVAGVVLITVVTTLGRRLDVAGPLLLVAVGVGLGFVPLWEIPPIPPEWILVGVLPPLLYSAAVHVPAVEFRRDLPAISALAIVLVIVTALLLGIFFHWVTGMPLPVGIALGAIVSPTDAVATSIAKRLGLPARVVTMLEGESLLNDATALVLLRTAVAAIAGGFAFWATVGAFAWAVVAALIVGALVGLVALRVRVWVGGAAVNTALGFTVPFLAYLPAEHLGASGLVAAVIAGLVTGQGSPRLLTPEQRLSDRMNWQMVELVLEGAVFLVMGLELHGLLDEVIADHDGIGTAVWMALAALAIVLVVRAAHVAVTVHRSNRRLRRLDRPRIERFGARLDAIADGDMPLPTRRRLGRRAPRTPRVPRSPERTRRRVTAMRTRVTRLLADIDYRRASPLTAAHGTVIVWAGMRGVVTLAAAQTLPRTLDHRALIVFVAFLVAALSLLLQGFTLPLLARALHLGPDAESDDGPDMHERLAAELGRAAASALADDSLRRADGTPFDPSLAARFAQRLTVTDTGEHAETTVQLWEMQLAVIDVKRDRLAELSHDGTYGTAALRHALAELDADELSLRQRLRER